MTYGTSKKKKKLELGTRKVTKARLLPLSVHFLVILVYASFSCSSDLMVESMAIDPHTEVLHQLPRDHTGQGWESPRLNTKFPCKGLWLVPWVRPLPWNHSVVFWGHHPTATKTVHDWAPLPWGRGGAITREEELDKQPKDEFTPLALNLPGKPPQVYLSQRRALIRSPSLSNLTSAAGSPHLWSRPRAAYSCPTVRPSEVGGL